MADSTTVSARYRITLPKGACEQVGIKPGQRVTFIVKHKTLTVVPVLSIDELQEMFTGVEMDISDYRDERDRY